MPGGRKCDPGCTCHKHSYRPPKCKPDCICDRHKNTVFPCPPGCTCRKHQATKGGRRKCAPGCRCGRHRDAVVKHPCYGTWQGMMGRCYQPTSPSYKNYGGRGITVCEEWRRGAAPFLRYLDEVLGPRPPKHTLDRILVNGNYEPGNIQWASRSEQAANRRPRTLKVRLKRTGSHSWQIA